MNELFLEWFGYIASLIVLISLLMSSIKRLRWINLVGALMFGFYGFMIGSIPTGMMNLGIVIIDVYYLIKMYRTSEFFRVIPMEKNDEYVRMFMDFYKEDIDLFSNKTYEQVTNSDIKLFVLRNMTPAGVFFADKKSDNNLVINLDYVAPQFRDFKIGNFVFKSQRDYFLSLGYKNFIAETDNPDHIKYVLKMGFVEDQKNKGFYKKSI